MNEPQKNNAPGLAKRSAWVYRAPAAPPVADLLAGSDKRRVAFHYHVTGNIKSLLDLMVHFGLKAMPAKMCSAAGALLGSFVVPRWHQSSVKKAQTNLKQMLPDTTEEERSQILKRSWQNQGRIMTEFSIVKRLVNRTVWHNLERFTEAHSKGPVIMVGMHLGNWEIFAPKLVELGLAPSANYTPPAGRARAWIAERVRRKLGYGLMPPGKDGIRPALKILKEGGAISVFCDEGFAGKIRGPFFGRAPHLKGNLALVVRLARMTGATICPGYILRRDGVKFDAYALPSVILPPENKPGERLIDDVLLLNSIIEPVIRAHLDQWYFLDNAL